MIRALLLGMCCAASATAADVVIVYNADVPRFTVAADVVAKAVAPRSVSRISLQGLSKSQAASRTLAEVGASTKAVVALGDRAAWVAQHGLGEVPYVFAMAAHWRTLGISRERGTGVSAELEPETFVSQLGLFLPGRTRVGVVHGEASAAQVARLADREKALAVEVMAHAVDDPNHVESALHDLAGRAQLLWLVEDPRVVTGATLEALRTLSQAARVPVVTWSSSHARAGFALAVGADPADVGRQISEQLQQVLAGAAPASVAIEAPQKAKVVVNLRAMREVGIEPDPIVLDFAEVVGR